MCLCFCMHCVFEHVTLTYFQCSPTPSLDAFMEHFNNNSQPTYVSLLCCGCSSGTIPVAEISHYWNVPQVIVL